MYAYRYGDRRTPGIATRVILTMALLSGSGGCRETVDQEEAAPLDLPAILATHTLLATIDELRNDARIPGLGVAIVSEGQVVALTGFGYADVEGKVRVDADTPFNIASVTKTMAGTVAMSLREKGILDFDSPMSEFAGFDELCTEALAAGGIFFDDWACDHPGLTFRHVMSMAANGSPGSRFYYNPVSFSWASRPMRQVTGTPFSELMDQIVFQPAGMTRSARTHRDLPLRTDLAEALATPYHLTDDGRLERSAPPPAQGDGAAGGVISTARDLAAFDLALDGGALIDAASRAEMWAPLSPTVPYGVGWFSTEWEGEAVVWHTGLWEGAYSALYIKVPSRGVALILLANSDGLRWDSGLDEASLERSPFARAFFESVFGRSSG